MKECKYLNKEVTEKECKKCHLFHPYISENCAYVGQTETCPLDGLLCNSSAFKDSSLYDCRHDFGFELRPCKGNQLIGISYNKINIPV